LPWMLIPITHSIFSFYIHMELFSPLLRLLIKKPHGTVNRQGKRKGLVVIILKFDWKDWFSRYMIHNFTSYHPAARELITEQTLWTSDTFFISPQLKSVFQKNFLYKTICFLPRCTKICVTKM
jgi:hypothetical protein